MELLPSLGVPSLNSIALVSLCLLFVLLPKIRRRLRVVQLINQLPGPAALPGIGNAIEINVGHDEMFTRFMITPSMWGGELGMNRAWYGMQPYVFIWRATTAEPILSSNRLTEKSRDYRFLHPWLNTGLLTSSGRKWHTRRKILTPTFHFRILEDFIDVFREHSNLLVKRVARELNNTGFDLFPYITLCALDIICETAMGRQVHAQEHQDSDYVKVIYEIGDIIQTRQAVLWMGWDWVFQRSKLYEPHQRCIRILHETSYKVIRERKEEIKLRKEGEKETLQDANDVLGQKKRLAFLDLLIEASMNGTVLSNEDIREEVDTFMFEGHDTTSAAISWCLFLLGGYPDIQDKVYEEIERVLGDEAISMKSLQELRYLECCIKEALRLYPSVPMMGRGLTEDVQIGEYTIPAGTTAIIMTYLLHRDPKIFPRPDVFDPDRFLPENAQGRHPYAYIPFSAGPRNCIGQKFAMLEEKCVLATFLRHYRVHAVERRENLMLLGELILRPKNGLCVQITRRQKVANV